MVRDCPGRGCTSVTFRAGASRSRRCEVPDGPGSIHLPAPPRPAGSGTPGQTPLLHTVPTPPIEGGPCSLTRKAQLVAPRADPPGPQQAPPSSPTSTSCSGTPVVTDEVPDGYEVALFGLGCFRRGDHWQVPGVWLTSVGYALVAPPRTRPTRRCAAARPASHRGRAHRLRPAGSRTPTWSRPSSRCDPTQGFRQAQRRRRSTARRSWTTP